MPVPQADSSQASPLPRRSPAELLALAVQRGVPLFNDGNPVACAAIYEVALEGVLAMQSPDISRQIAEDIATALDAARDEHDPAARAWLLRDAIDAAYAALPAGT